MNRAVPNRFAAMKANATGIPRNRNAHTIPSIRIMAKYHSMAQKPVSEVAATPSLPARR